MSGAGNEGSRCLYRLTVSVRTPSNSATALVSRYSVATPIMLSASLQVPTEAPPGCPSCDTPPNPPANASALHRLDVPEDPSQLVKTAARARDTAAPPPLRHANPFAIDLFHLSRRERRGHGVWNGHLSDPVGSGVHPIHLRW
jgi:hypothetical protein